MPFMNDVSPVFSHVHELTFTRYSANIHIYINVYIADV